MGQIREKMVADLALRGLSLRTRALYYLLYARAFIAFHRVSPTTLGTEHVRTWLLVLLNERRRSPSTVNVAIAALRFLFSTTLGRPDVMATVRAVRVQHHQPDVPSGSEVAALLDHARSTSLLRDQARCTVSLVGPVEPLDLAHAHAQPLGHLRLRGATCADLPHPFGSVQLAFAHGQAPRRHDRPGTSDPTFQSGRNPTFSLGAHRDPSHRIRFVYTPKHTSWLNQVEIWFSILVRRLLKRASFVSAEELRTQALAFIGYFNRTLAKPFRWTYQGRPLRA